VGASWSSDNGGSCHWDCNRYDGSKPEVTTFYLNTADAQVEKRQACGLACLSIDISYGVNNEYSESHQLQWNNNKCHWDCDASGDYTFGDKNHGIAPSRDIHQVCCPEDDQEWDGGSCKLRCKDESGNDHLVDPSDPSARGSQCHESCDGPGGATAWLTKDDWNDPDVQQSQCYQDCGNDPWVPLDEKCPAGLVVTGGTPDFLPTPLSEPNTSMNVHGEATIISRYKIGRTDRPRYICRKIVGGQDENGQSIKRLHHLFQGAYDDNGIPYTCPPINECLTKEGPNNYKRYCQCLNSENQSVVDTYCDYAYVSPLRNENFEHKGRVGVGEVTDVEFVTSAPLTIQTISVPTH